MRYIASYIFVLFIFFAASCSDSDDIRSSRLADTHENRAKLTKHYLEIVPIRKMMDDMGEELVASMPAEKQEKFREFWKISISDEYIVAVQTVAQKSFTKHMTVDELQAFIRFMEDPAGRSAMNKMKFYMADVMPIIQKQAISVIGKFRNIENN